MDKLWWSKATDAQRDVVTKLTMDNEMNRDGIIAFGGDMYRRGAVNVLGWIVISSVGSMALLWADCAIERAKQRKESQTKN